MFFMVNENPDPKHIGIILDGNRRYAKRLVQEPWKGHEHGVKPVEKLFEWAIELGLKELTLYALSTENLKRDKKEVDYLLNLMKKEFAKLYEKENLEKIEKNKIKLVFIGNLDLLPKELKEECLKLQRKTSKNNNLIVNFAIAYGGRMEIVDAVKKIISKKIKAEDVDEEIVKENLYLNDEPDLIIRTGGVKRTSNFLPFQSAYSEWFFLDKLWPEFTKEDLISVIEDFKKRKRNFGK
jgi:undecaprenyl diphosphate synthase